jgi:hypothetical protein
METNTGTIPRTRRSRTSNRSPEAKAIPELPDEKLDVEIVSDKPSSATEVSGELVEAQLQLLSYIPIAKYLMGEPRAARYIKAYNPYGQIVFIYLDEPGDVIDDETCVVIQPSAAAVVPISMKISASECAKLNVCGIAFDCKGELCTLRRNEEKPGQVDELIMTKNCNKEIDIEDMPYPIIKMSELKSDPEITLRVSSDTYKRLRNRHYGLIAIQMEETNESIKYFYEAVNDFYKRTTCIVDQLSSTIKQLESHADSYRGLDTMTENNKKK